MLLFFLLCLFFVLAFRDKTPSMARFLRRFKLGRVFASGFVGFYFLLFALCKAHNDLSASLHAFYAYVRSPSIVLLAIACGGFLAFTVWVFSSRTTSRSGATHTGTPSEPDVTATAARSDKTLSVQRPPIEPGHSG